MNRIESTRGAQNKARLEWTIMPPPLSPASRRRTERPDRESGAR
jgi:hypothetical protein